MLDQLFEGQALWFTIPALLGTAMFSLRILMMLIGGAGDGDFGADADFDGADFDGEDSTSAFTVLSIQGVSAFLGGFGWAGIGALLGMHWEMAPAAAVGVAGGVSMAWLLGLVLKGIYDLQSSGTMSPETAVGFTGEVYLTVPGGGHASGQVRVVVRDRQRIYDAITQGEELPTKTRVRVLAVNDDNTLMVTLA
ncbi:MAG: hypothetical protein ACI9EF_000434 [Pseudohongiellaceae bacterium]|jgi:hypothetical protein